MWEDGQGDGMLRAFGLGIVLLATGCYKQTLHSGGEDTYKFFPLDGDRTWTYQATDTSLPYRLVAHKPSESELLEDIAVRVYTITFSPDCQGAVEPCLADEDADSVPDFETTPLMVWRISSDSIDGTEFHSFNDEDFDPPVLLADADQSEDEVVTSESGGISYASTIIAEGPCDVPYWRGEPPEGCKTFQLDDAGGGSPVAGEYMSIVQFGIVQFTIGGIPSTWQLKAYEDEL
jgi:hypothetical protein